MSQTLARRYVRVRSCRLMPFLKLPDTDQRYALMSFDDDGLERKDDPEGGVFSKAILAHVTNTPPSHVFVFTHGWKGDLLGAVDQCNRWIGAMFKLDAERTAMGATLQAAVHRTALAQPALGRGDVQ